MLKENLDNVYQIRFSLNIIWPKWLTLDQSYSRSNPNTKLTTWLLSKTDEVRLRLINLRERERDCQSVDNLPLCTTSFNCNLCSTKKMNYCTYQKSKTKTSNMLLNHFCCSWSEFKWPWDTNMSSTGAEFFFIWMFYSLHPVWKQPETFTPGSGLSIVTSLFSCNSSFQYWGGSKKASTSHYILPFFTYLTRQ